MCLLPLRGPSACVLRTTARRHPLITPIGPPAPARQAPTGSCLLRFAQTRMSVLLFPVAQTFLSVRVGIHKHLTTAPGGGRLSRGARRTPLPIRTATAAPRVRASHRTSGPAAFPSLSARKASDPSKDRRHTAAQSRLPEWLVPSTWLVHQDGPASGSIDFGPWTQDSGVRTLTRHLAGKPPVAPGVIIYMVEANFASEGIVGSTAVRQ